MPFLTIKKLKSSASFQDLGRNNAQHLGFSGSGAADEYSYLLANKLIGNELYDNSLINNEKIINQHSNVTLEVTLGQFTLITNQTCRLVITGADCQSHIRKKNGEEIVVKNNIVFELSPEEELNLGLPKKQLHSYIAIEGGFSVKTYLNSASQTVNEYALKLGEAELKEGKTLPFSIGKSSLIKSEFFPPEKPINKPDPQDNFHQSEQLYLRFLPSPLWLKLTPKTQQLFLNQPYQITPQSNRMGYRLCSETMIINRKASALSKPTNYGTIQLPDDGQPIVLMKERQTIGGYPTLGTVIQTDLFRLSQKRPGEKVFFVPISLEQAQAQLMAFHERFNFR